MSLKVYKECCQNCLLSEDKIVSARKAKKIITNCKKEQSYFVCHVATMENKEIVCKKFFDQFGQYSQMVRIAERLNAIEFVEQPKKEKLIPYNQQRNKRP